jgi:hypothetical protein
VCDVYSCPRVELCTLKSVEVHLILCQKVEIVIEYKFCIYIVAVN